MQFRQLCGLLVAFGVLYSLLKMANISNNASILAITPSAKITLNNDEKVLMNYYLLKGFGPLALKNVNFNVKMIMRK